MTGDDRCGDTYSRRRVLRGIGTATAGLATASVVTGPAAAGKGGDCDPDGDPPRIDTSDHFDTTWWGSVYRTDGNTEDSYDTAGGTLPEEPDELVVHVHGWRNDEECGIAAIEATGDTYDAVDYDDPVTGLTWDSAYAWWNAKEIADRNAPKLAAFLTEYAEQNPETTLRVQAHSLGARVLAETLLELDEEGADDVLTSAVFMAGAIDNESVAVNGEYGPAIENVVDHAENFWMPDDDVLDWAYSTFEFSQAIGNDGCDGEPPANYTDREVTKDIGHSDYYEDEDVIQQVVETYGQ
jgi:hypothetical protein